jgi:hypothetical protein
MSAGTAVVYRLRDYPDADSPAEVLELAARDLYDGHHPDTAELALRLHASPRLDGGEMMRWARRLGECLTGENVMDCDPQADRNAGDPLLTPEEIAERRSDYRYGAETALGILLNGD